MTGLAAAASGAGFWVLVVLATVTGLVTAWALGALMQGGAISETVGAGLIDGVAITSLAATAGLLTATLLRRDDVPDTVGIPLLAALVGGIVAKVRMGVIPDPSGGEQGSLAGYVAGFVDAPAVGAVDLAAVAVTLLAAAAGFQFIRRRTQESVDRGVRTFLVLLGSLVAFSSGGSQVGLATGPLENLYRTELGLPALVLLAVGATGILAGAWMGAPRLLQATSREYAQLGVRRSIAALVPGFVIAQAAIALGIPLSFNNVIISGVIGGGLAGGSAGVSRRKIGVTLAFWLVTLVASVAIGFGLYRVFATALGV